MSKIKTIANGIFFDYVACETPNGIFVGWNDSGIIKGVLKNENGDSKTSIGVINKNEHLIIAKYLCNKIILGIDSYDSFRIVYVDLEFNSMESVNYKENVLIDFFEVSQNQLVFFLKNSTENAPAINVFIIETDFTEAINIPLNTEISSPVIVQMSPTEFVIGYQQSYKLITAKINLMTKKIEFSQCQPDCDWNYITVSKNRDIIYFAGYTPNQGVTVYSYWLSSQEDNKMYFYQNVKEQYSFAGVTMVNNYLLIEEGYSTSQNRKLIMTKIIEKEETVIAENVVNPVLVVPMRSQNISIVYYDPEYQELILHSITDFGTPQTERESLLNSINSKSDSDNSLGNNNPETNLQPDITDFTVVEPKE